MINAFTIVLREAFEAALVLGLVFAFLRKMGHDGGHARAVWAGAAAAIAVSAGLGAVLFLTAGELKGTAERLYEGGAMLVAAIVLTGMVFWMRRQAASIGGHLRAQVSEAIASGGRTGLALVAFVAVVREGLETALFLFAATGQDGALSTVVGGALGLAAAVGLGLLFYRGSLRLDLGRFFLVTGLLVIVFAAYLLAGSLHELGEAAGTGAADVLGVVAAVAYAAGFGALYWRAARAGRRPAGPPAPPAGAAA